MSNTLSGRARGFVALGLVVLLALGVTLAVVVKYRGDHPTDNGLSLTSSGTAIPDAKDGEAAVKVAEDFLLKYDTFDSANVEKYINGMAALMTTKFQGDKTQTIAGLKAEFTNTANATQTKGKIVKGGISTQDVDSATVVVLHAKETATKSGNFIENDRTLVTLRKVDGTWLVDGAVNFQNQSQTQDGATQ